LPPHPIPLQSLRGRALLIGSEHHDIAGKFKLRSRSNSDTSETLAQSANFARSAVSRKEKPLPTCSNNVRRSVSDCRDLIVDEHADLGFVRCFGSCSSHIVILTAFLPFEQTREQAPRKTVTERRHSFGHGFHNSHFAPIFSYLDSFYQAVSALRFVCLRAKEK
jgi:hypothetical protein